VKTSPSPKFLATAGIFLPLLEPAMALQAVVPIPQSAIRTARLSGSTELAEVSPKSPQSK
jgi:hypothetical protein